MSELNEPRDNKASALRESMARYCRTINEEGIDPIERDERARQDLTSMFKYLPRKVMKLKHLRGNTGVIKPGATVEEILEGDTWDLLDVLDHVHDLEEMYI